MGLGEMMGVKNVKLELKGNYATLADLLEAMKDIQFEAGVPELTKHGIGAVIVFPPVDRNNQVGIRVQMENSPSCAVQRWLALATWRRMPFLIP